MPTEQPIEKKQEANGEIQIKVIQCHHCKGEGTCLSGKDASTCEVCARKNLKWTLSFCFSKPRYGMVCSVCGGVGEVEPLTERLNNRIEPVLAMILVYFALIMTWSMAWKDDKHFPEILAFSSTIIGSITGYYFGGKKR